MIVVVTALVGPTEWVSPPPRVRDVRFVCYTDRDAPGWECRPPPPGNPRRAARMAKMAVHDDFPDAVTIWIDASFDFILSPVALVDAAAKLSRPVVAFRHPDRDRVTDEAAVITELGLAPALPVAKQVEAYRLAGFDTDERPQRALTTTGVMVRWPDAATFTRMWKLQIEQFTLRDQLSVDYSAWRTHTMIGYLPGHYRSNEFVRYDRAQHKQGRVT